MKNPALLLPTFALTFGMLAAAYAQDPFTNGLVAYYPFNGDANDGVGNGRNALVMGSGTSLTNGVNGAPNCCVWCVAPGGVNLIQGPRSPARELFFVCVALVRKGLCELRPFQEE